MNPTRYCTFEVGGLLIGIDIDNVQEVLRGQEITSVPLAHPSVLGLVNLRGQIVTAIDARRRLGLPDRGPEDGGTHVIIRSDGEAVSLIVDAEGEVVDVESDAMEHVPETLGSEIRDLLTAIYELDESSLLLVLEADRVLSVTASRG